MRKRTKALIAVGAIAAAAYAFDLGTGIMGDYPKGETVFLPLPRSQEALTTGLYVVLSACGVVVLASRALGEVLGELLVQVLFPERVPVAEFWASLSDPLRAVVTTAVSGGYRRVSLKGELLREAMHLPRQPHLRFASRRGSVMVISRRLEAVVGSAPAWAPGPAVVRGGSTETVRLEAPPSTTGNA